MKKENGIKRLNRLSVKAKEYRDENTQVVKLSQAIEVIELLDEPKPLTEDQAWKVIGDVYNQDADRWKDAKNHYLNSIKEKEAPVVKQFVADWFEENKDNLDNTIFYYCRDLHDTIKEDLEKFDEWFMESNDSIETLIKMKNGYEVVKEPRWRIKKEGSYLEALVIPSEGNKTIYWAPMGSYNYIKFKTKTKAELIKQLVGGEIEEV